MELQQPSPTPDGFDADVVWQTLAGLGDGILRRLPFILIGLGVFLVFYVLGRAVSDRVATGIKLALDAAGIDMPDPHAVVLFHDATGARGGDIDRA
ncbi:MAG TPA: hypothetical protein VK421_05265, partial [Pyrinomonadaceae bacterium]|nr:hypothetical protein [Pyrinomonadaceae bacterium]